MWCNYFLHLHLVVVMLLLDVHANVASKDHY